MNIEWTSHASVQANEVLKYAEEHFGKKAAKRIATKIGTNNIRLTDNPLLGPPEPELSHRTKEYRYLIVDENYKMLYYIECDTIYIVALWHRSLNPKRMSKLFR